MKINLKDINLIVYDFDGVMTDNRVLVFENGMEAVFCNRADGLAISEIKKRGAPQLIITTERNNVVKARAKKLGIEIIYGVNNKKSVLMEYCKKRNYNLKKIIYVGNEINDLEVMQLVGYPVAPSDAHERTKKAAKFITNAKGGEGVIRELYELLI